MTTTDLTEHTVTVNGKPIFFAETGTGPAVVMLHGGGPGASGVSNYSRNIDALAQYFRVIVPDMPGYGRSVKGVDQDDPFGYLADMIRGLLDELGIDTAHLIGNSYGGAAALRLALDSPHRVDKLVLMGPGGIGTTRGVPTAGLKSLLSYYRGDGPSRDKLEAFISTYLVYDGASLPDELIDLRYAASAVVFIHPADLPDPTVPGSAPFAADFLLDTTRAAYLLVRNGIRRKYPSIRFILSHAGGFVPYASHRMAVAIMADTGRSPADSLDDFSASTSTPHCPRARPLYPPCSSSRSPAISRSDPTGPSRPLPRANSSPQDWKRTRAWTPTLAMPSTAPTPSPCSHDSARRRYPNRALVSTPFAMVQAGRRCGRLLGSSAPAESPHPPMLTRTGEVAASQNATKTKRR